MIKSSAIVQSSLREFKSRFFGPLRDWSESLGLYLQLELIQIHKVLTALGLIYEQFIRETTAAQKLAKRDYLQMKCCSLQMKDLDFNYKRMSTLYYKLNGFNDHTLKHVSIASRIKELQSKIQ